MRRDIRREIPPFLPLSLTVPVAPQANLNPRLVVQTRLCYDFARCTLHHGITNDMLERRLAHDPHPSTPLSSADRATAIAAAAADIATDAEAAPFRSALGALISNAEMLRAESAACREAALAFVTSREGAFGALLARAAPPSTAETQRIEPATWKSASELAATAGVLSCNVDLGDLALALRPTATNSATSAVARRRARYRVVHAPFVFVRAAPSTKAEVLTMAPTNAEIEVEIEGGGGWVRTADALENGRHGWLLVDGAPLGLGRLLEPCERDVT